MSNKLVIQSHRSPLPFSWLQRCLDSVRYWCEKNRYQYQFLGDDLFDYVPADLREKLTDQPVIASDLARLNVLRNRLNKGFETVVWLDADFLIFDPENFILPDLPFAVGREVWIQRDRQKKLKVYRKVHNAFLSFRQENSFLSFYAESAERLLRQNQSGIPAQFIGPKLLTALHNIVQLPVMETAGMLSPLVVKDILQGEDTALQLFKENSPDILAGANLCISSRERKELSCSQMEELIDILLNKSVLK